MVDFYYVTDCGCAEEEICFQDHQVTDINSKHPQFNL